MSKIAIISSNHTYERLPFFIDLLHSINAQTYIDGVELFFVDDSLDNRFLPFFEHLCKIGTIPKIIAKPVPAGYKGKKTYLIAEGAPGRPDEKLRFSITFLRGDGRLGASRACNVGIEAAIKKGFDYIRLIDGDDTMLYDSLKLQKHILDSQPEINSVSSDKLEFGISHLGYQSKYHPNPDTFRCQAAFWGSGIYKTAVMFRASILKDMPDGKLFDDEYVGVGDDIVMNGRLARVGGLFTIPLPLVYYRRHVDNLSITNLPTFKVDYSKAVRQVLKENCGVEVSDEFSHKYFEVFHKFQKTPYYVEFIEETREILKKCEFTNPEALDGILDSVKLKLSQQEVKI